MGVRSCATRAARSSHSTTSTPHSTRRPTCAALWASQPTASPAAWSAPTSSLTRYVLDGQTASAHADQAPYVAGSGGRGRSAGPSLGRRPAWALRALPVPAAEPGVRGRREAQAGGGPAQEAEQLRAIVD